MVWSGLIILLAAAQVFAQAAATITRDNYGVPHIQGRTDADVVFGLAYAMAEDNFWQLEEDYVRAIGRAAELHGPSESASDIGALVWGVQRRAQQQLEGATPYIRALCEAFAAGYNSYLARNPAVKARLLTRMEPWHVLAFQDPRPSSLFSGGVRRDEVLREFFILKESPAEPPADRSDEGSNMWAVSPKKSASGRAMLFINPHVEFFGGGQRFEAHLESKQGLRVSGFAILGTPYIRSGFTDRHGWSHTNNNADLIDVYRETFDKADDPLWYRYGGGYRKAETAAGEVRVKRNGRIETIKISFRRTHHGPILGIRDGHPLAVRALDIASPDLMIQRIGMAKAKSLDEFKRVLARRAITGSNTLYADRRGNIYYLHGNAIPKRDPGFDWSGPVDGSDPRTEWQGIHEFAELPQQTNPASGYLQNCNSTPYFASGKIADPPQAPRYFVPETDNFRAQRSRQILESRDRFTYEQWTEAATDTRVFIADRDRAHLMSLWPAFEQQHPARANGIRGLVTALREWDGAGRVDSVGMALFMAAFLLRPNTSDTGPQLTPELVEKVRSELERDFGTWRVKWGDINRLQRIHSSGRLETYSDSRPSLPVPGAPGTVGIIFNFYSMQPKGERRLYGRTGNSYLAVVEFGKKLRSQSLLVFGQSADPASPHYLDQAPLYSEGRFEPAHYYSDDVKRHAKRTYRIE